MEDDSSFMNSLFKEKKTSRSKKRGDYVRRDSESEGECIECEDSAGESEEEKRELQEMLKDTPVNERGDIEGFVVYGAEKDRNSSSDSDDDNYVEPSSDDSGSDSMDSSEGENESSDSDDDVKIVSGGENSIPKGKKIKHSSRARLIDEKVFKLISAVNGVMRVKALPLSMLYHSFRIKVMKLKKDPIVKKIKKDRDMSSVPRVFDAFFEIVKVFILHEKTEQIHQKMRKKVKSCSRK
jgi:hypothetical protein